MRNLFFLLLCMSFFGLSSCGSDDDSDVSISMDNIAGDWNLTLFDNDADITITGFGTSEIMSDINNSSVIVNFTATGTWNSTGSFDLNVVSPDTSYTEPITGGIGSGTYTIANGQLSMTGIDAGDEADTETPTVFNVTEFRLDDLLDLSGTASESFMDPFFGLEVSTDVTTLMILER